MKFFIKLISFIFVIMETMKGGKTTTIINYPFNSEEFLEVKFNGIELHIFCRKKQYRRSYDKWYITGDKRTVFQVYSKIINMPEHSDEFNAANFKLACTFEADIPALLPEFVEFKYHRIVITHAYIDIVSERLKRINFGYPP